MNRLLVLILVMAGVLQGGAQPVSFKVRHEKSVMHAFLVMYDGGVALNPTVYYDLAEKGYQYYAYENPLISPRMKEQMEVQKQQSMAERLDSALRVRAKQEALYMADRMSYGDTSWLLEGEKIRRAMDAYKENIGKIYLEGGRDQEAWMARWYVLQEGIDGMRTDYMPSSERHKQFLEILKEARRQNSELANYLFSLRCLKKAKMDVHTYDSVQKMPRAHDMRSVGTWALGRWKYSLGMAH